MDWNIRVSQRRIQRLAEAAIRNSTDQTRHQCFVSYHVDDEDEVSTFVETFGTIFKPTVVGVTEDDDFVSSDDTDYIMDRIREEYLSSTTVTIVLIGLCTWSRRFIDWEVYASLRRYKGYPPSGLMAITLPSVAANPDRRLPARVQDNVVNSNEGYARWTKYPSSEQQLRDFIQSAFNARTLKADLIENSRTRKINNSACS
jgi:hypothetical protein